MHVWASLIYPNCNLFAVLPQFEKVENFSIFNIRRNRGHSPECFENEDTRAPTEFKFSRQGIEQIGAAIATPLIFLQSLFPNAKLSQKAESPNPLELWRGQPYNYFKIQPLALKPHKTEYLNCDFLLFQSRKSGSARVRHQPLFFTQPSQTPFEDMYEQETPPAPPQSTPFPGLILKVGKMNYCLGKMDPIWAKCLKSGQNFSRNGQKKSIHLVRAQVL